MNNLNNKVGVVLSLIGEVGTSMLCYYYKYSVLIPFTDGGIYI